MNAVSWYDSEATDNRRRCVRWQPGAATGNAGYLFLAERENPFDMWPTMQDAPDYDVPVSLYEAREFARRFGCWFSDDDPAGLLTPYPTGRHLAACPEPVVKVNDPDDLTAVTVNVSRAQGRVLRNLVDGLLTFAPDDSELRYLRAQLDRAVEGVR